MAVKSTAIELPALDIQTVKVRLIGDSPLIVHAWSAKAKKAMLDKQQKKATTGRAAKDPWQDFCESLYWLDGMPEKSTEADVETARFGFPSVGFKNAAVTACTSIGSITKVAPRPFFHGQGPFVPTQGGVPMAEGPGSPRHGPGPPATLSVRLQVVAAILRPSCIVWNLLTLVA